MKKVTEFLRNNVSQITFVVLSVITVITPILVLPLTQNFMLDSKLVLVFLAGFLTLFLWGLSTFVKRSIQITLSPFLTPLLAFGAVALVSSFMNSPYPITQLLGWGGAYISLIVMVLFGSSLLKERSSKVFLNVLLIPAFFLTLASFAEMIGFGPSRVFNVLLGTQFPSSSLFSLAGSPIISVEFLFVVLVGIIASIVSSKKKILPLYIVSAVIISAGIAMNGYSVYQIQKQSPIILPYAASYSIAIDGLKSVRSSLIGFGPENYTDVYNVFKPVWLNTTPLWGTYFTQGSNFPFTIISTLGLLGFAAYLFLIFQAIKMWHKRTVGTTAAAAIFLAAVLIEFFLPINIVLLSIQMMALIFWIAADKSNLKDVQLHAFTVQLIKSGEETKRIPQHSNFMVYIICAVTLVILVGCGYFIGMSTIAQYFDFQSALAAAHNNVVEVYNNEQLAINFNQWSDVYHRNYATTNLSIASALSSSKDPNNAPDKNKILTLIQQAIREAKVATQIDPSNSLNWVTLGRIYTNLIGVADQADQWSIAAYTQGTALAPQDPVAHLEFGSVYYNIGRFDEATQLFQQTAAMKPNWPNAFYNLANALRRKNQLPEAIAAYQTTLSLLDSKSSDYAKVKVEMEDVQAQGTKGRTATPTVTQPVTSLTPSTIAPAVAPTPVATTSAKRKVKAAVEPSPSPSTN